MSFRKIKAGLVNSDVEQFIGETGNLFFDIDTGILRLSDGITPGGTIVSGGSGGGGTYTLPTATTTVKGGIKIDGTTIAIDNGTISVGTVPYTSITGTPTVPTKVSDLTNDTGFITGVSWTQVTGKPTLFSGAYADLTGKPTTLSTFTNDSGYISLSTLTWTNLSGKPTFAAVATSGSYNDLSNKPSLFSGAYADLSGKPTVPTAVSQLTNDSGFITSSALSSYATQSYVTGRGYITSASLPTKVSDLSNDSGFLVEADFDLNTINYDANGNLHATGILPGDANGFTAVFAGRAAGVAALPNTVIQSQAQVNDYAQNNFQNTSDGDKATTEWVATSPNGNDTDYYIDMGINGASWDGTAENSLYTNVGQRDGWLYVQGGNAGGGNLVLGTSLVNTYTKIIAGNVATGDREVARFSSTEVKLKKQLTFNDNTTQTTAWTGTVPWDSVSDKPALFSGSWNDLTDFPSTTGTGSLVFSSSPTITNPTFSGTFAFESDNTTQPAMTLTASNLNDGVGILRVIGSEPDINFNQVSEVAGFNTFTFEWNGNPKLAMGRRNDHSFYITRNDGEWHDNALVLDYATGVLSIESGISVPTIYFTDETYQTTAWTGSVDWANITNQPTLTTSLSALTDVNVTGAITGQVLTYDSVTHTWIPGGSGGGATGALGYYGSFYDVTAQQTNAGASSANLVLIGGTYEANGITIQNGSKITFSYAGTYSIVFSLQFVNDNAAEQDVSVWLKTTVNGTTTNVDDSTVVYTIDADTGSLGKLVAINPFIITVAAGEQIQIYWQSPSTDVYLKTIAAQTSPSVPRAPAVILTVEQTSSIVVPDSISGNAGSVTNGVYTTDTGTVTNTMLAGSIANNKLANSSLTVNGTSITLGSSGTVTANTANALTIGRGLAGTASTFNGSAAVTVSLDTSTTNITATAGATTTLDAATITRYYNLTGSISGTHTIKLPDLTTLTAGQQITFFTSQATIAFQLSTGTSILTNTVATARQTTFTVVSTASNASANLSYTQVVSGLSGTGTSLLTNLQPSINVAYITGLDSTTSTTAYASTPSLTFGPSTSTFSHTLNILTAATAATYTKNLNIGTNLNGGTSTINIGTGVTSGTATLNLGSATTTTTMNGAVTITSLTATNSIAGSITGNAATATKLGTARTINNVSFDGTASITITANNPNALTIGTGLIGTSYDGSTAVTIAVDSTVALRADTHYIGTTSIALNRSSASQTLTGVSIDGNAATVTNGLYSTSTYSNPSWISSLAYSKLTGAPTLATVATSGLYTDLSSKPTIYSSAYIGTTSLDFTRSSASQTLTGISIDGNAATVTNGVYTTGTYSNPAWITSLAYSKLTGTPTLFSGAYADLTGKPTLYSSAYIGTTSLDFTRASASQTLTGISIDGNSATVTNGLYSTGSYANPAWITSLAYSKLTGAPTVPTNVSQLTNDSGYLTSAAAGSLTGTTLASGVTASSLTSVGTLNGLTVTKSTTGTALSITAANLPAYGGTATWQFVGNGNIGGASSWIQFPDSSVQTTAYTGNAATVTNGVYTTDTGTVTNTMLAGSIANSKLANSTITVNGTSISLGSSGTVTAAAGTLTGTTLNSSVVTSSLTSVGTLTGLTSSGAVLITNTTASQSSTTGALQVRGGVGVSGNIYLGGGINATGSIYSAGVNVSYSPDTPTGQAFQATGKDTLGGTGYFDFFKINNTTSGGTNGSKTMRLNSVGTLEILNNAYNATILSITDAGFIAINKATGVTDGVPSTNGIAMNSNSYIYDDGNYHLTSKAGVIWLNANDGSAVNINTQMPSGITGGGLNVQGAVKSYGAGSSTAFISSGSNVVSGVALQLDSGTPGTAAQMAIRDTSTVSSTMYFDTSTGGSAHGSFQFRSSNAFTQLMSLSNSQVSINKQTLFGGGSFGAYVTITGTNSYNLGGPYGYLSSGGAGSVGGGGASGTVGWSLQCNGRIQTNEIDATSDERLKDIQGTIPLDRALQFVRAVDGILYTWKPGFGDEGLKSGFGAQSVHKAGFDHMVAPIPNDRVEGSTDADGFTSPDKFQLTLNYMEAIPYHHEVIKHLLDRIEQLEARLAKKE